MNLITFNEHFAAVTTKEGRARYEKACVAPLFDYVSIKTHTDECVERLVERVGRDDDGTTPFELPFPIMRASFKLKNKARDQHPLIRYECMMFAETASIYFRVPSERSIKRELYLLQLFEGGGFEVDHWVDRERSWRRVYKTHIKTAPEGSSAVELYSQLVGTVVGFCMDAMSPNLHTAAVSPDEPNRSVQWTKARTHYTFISHGHPANKATVGHGERIATNTTDELTRMAHNRRAHVRTLTDKRYRFKRGQQIKVKATWVGPKEWRDEGGKQIYRILEPSDWKPGDPVFK